MRRVLRRPAAFSSGTIQGKGSIVSTNPQESGVVKALDQLYEFEREPVSADRLQPGRHFAGLFAGEHVAGTEFAIGAMFVAWGVNAWDIFVGLALGNLMAVLTWTLLCAPIAVQTRLTLYWYLRRIAGPVTTTIYNVLNAFLFCILAGCMITVSASAVRIPFGIPPQIGWIPTDFRFVLIVILVGAVVVTLAILGFKRLAQFASVCSPWMFLMFIGGAVVLLPGLAKLTPGVNEVHGWSDFWHLATNVIWTGKAPEGQTAMTFWQVAAFAWICNLAMHGGLSDMALFRYARHWGYGLYSAFGMFLGHYLAWICAGMMGAATMAMLNLDAGQLDAGGLAFHALGVTGIIAVVIAGWTTSNPTLYRAGLALQAVTPGWPRWLVTLVAGTFTTLIACSPWVFVKLLDFVGYYGLLLMPVGAVVFAEHWIFPRIGLTRFWATRNGRNVFWPALGAWVVAIAVAITLKETGYLHLFFLFLPTWVLTIVLYIIFASLAGARSTAGDKAEEAAVAAAAPKKAALPAAATVRARTTAETVSGALALLSLAVCLLWPLMILVRGTEGYEARLDFFKVWLIVPTLVYFVAGTAYAVLRDKGDNA